MKKILILIRKKNNKIILLKKKKGDKIKLFNLDEKIGKNNILIEEKIQILNKLKKKIGKIK